MSRYISEIIYYTQKNKNECIQNNTSTVPPSINYDPTLDEVRVMYKNKYGWYPNNLWSKILIMQYLPEE